MARVNVFLSDELLERVDAAAAEIRLRRSALIQAALSDYLQDRKRARERAGARREMEQAGHAIDALAEKLGSWDPVAIIREHRDRRSASVHEPSPRYRPAKRKPRK